MKKKKRETYRLASNQVRAQVKRHTNVVATLANVAAILKERFPNFFWVGFYFDAGSHLVLGPFQGPPACMTLSFDKGVCAAAFTAQSTQLVPDVHAFPGHVACDSRSNSEIVIPLSDTSGCIRAVLDVDSAEFNDFDDIDRRGLERIAGLLAPIFS